MYSTRPNLILGFHGCEKSEQEKLLSDADFIKKSNESFDSVRAAFIEGEPIYPGAGFHGKTHIQLCIINPNCIKGFFLLRTKNRSYSIV